MYSAASMDTDQFVTETTTESELDTEQTQPSSKQCSRISIVLALISYSLLVVFLFYVIVDDEVANLLLSHGRTDNILSNNPPETESIGVSIFNLNDSHHTNSTEQHILPEDNRTYPTYLVILKSPRSGSTFMHKALTENLLIFEKFEPRLDDARSHFRNCPQYHTQIESDDDSEEKKKWTCSISLNDYLREGRYHQINDLIRDYSATVVIQLRANVVEKSISASKIWGNLQPKRHATEQQIAEDIISGALRGLDTIRGHVIADKLMPSDDPALWVWYEDLIRDCSFHFERIYQAIGLPFVMPQKCNEATFIGPEPYDTYLVNALKKEPALESMINHLTFNQEVNTDDIYRKIMNETMNVTTPSLGHWRRLRDESHETR